jgi:hypothetical protein
MLLRTKRSFTLLLALVVFCSAQASGSLAQSESTRAATAVFGGGCSGALTRSLGISKAFPEWFPDTQEEARTRRITKPSAPAATGHAETTSAADVAIGHIAAIVLWHQFVSGSARAVEMQLHSFAEPLGS